jgi:AAA+ ATPase superfamily predicted ATPase
MMIGRQREIGILNDCYRSRKSEFVAVYGRRRIGKTFLVKELFEQRFTFYATGVLNGGKSAQLRKFDDEILYYGGDDASPAKDWFEAFDHLRLLVEKADSEGKKVIFLDEVPWMATMHSDFLPALDYFWNRWASSRGDIFLIICGSSTSWIVSNIINNRAGLHNRLTRSIYLQPFTLKECEDYYREFDIPMTRYQMAEAYMIFGGVPYYLSLMEPRYSLYQNVDAMYFASGAELSNEFDNLYRSLFKNADNHIKIVETLAKKNKGLTHGEIADAAGLADGGRLTAILRELTLCGFIRRYDAFGKKKRDRLYQLIDGFTIFQVRFKDKRDHSGDAFWLPFSATPAHGAWSGYAFERVCLLHVPQIKNKLGISGVMTEVSSWRSENTAGGTQVDLVIDRSDKIVNLCEIKYASAEYEIKKEYDEKLRRRKEVFASETRTRKAVQTTMITTFGLRRNAYSTAITSEVVLDDLFI